VAPRATPRRGPGTLRPVSRARLCERLLDFIHTERMKVGDRLPAERELAAQLGGEHGLGQDRTREIGVVQIRESSSWTSTPVRSGYRQHQPGVTRLPRRPIETKSAWSGARYGVLTRPFSGGRERRGCSTPL
jgi:hypothetical protein